MEEIIQFILGLILELFGEVFLQLVCELFTEVVLSWLSILFFEDGARQEKPRPVIFFLGYAFLGSLVGIVSQTFFPQHFIRTILFRRLNLIVTPLIAGVVMAALGRWRDKRGQRIIGLDKFFYGWGFALAFAIVRLLWCY